MHKYIKEIQGRIEYTTEFKVKTAKEVRERMDAVMAERGEGLVMKHPMSQYVLNGRNSDWIKVHRLFFLAKSFLTRFDPRSNLSIWYVHVRALLVKCSRITLQDNMGETVDVLVVGKSFKYKRIYISRPYCSSSW